MVQLQIRMDLQQICAVSTFLYSYRSTKFFLFSRKNAECTSTELELSMVLVFVIETFTSKSSHYGSL